jgi:tRNA nucleotidyltransferase (CCA-adding enzyme)
MLRAVRLACELDFKIDKTVLQAIEGNSSLIKKVSPERIRDEFIRMLLSNYPQRGLKLLEQEGLLKYILPELIILKGVKTDDIYPVEDLFTYNLKLTDHLPSNLVLRLTALLSFPSSAPREEMVFNILKRLKFKNSIIKKAVLLGQEDWERICFSQGKEIRKYLAKMSLEEVKNIFILKEAALKVKKKDKERTQLKQEEERVKAVLAQKPPLSLKDLALKGQDLKDLGYPEGKKLGQVLKELLNLVLEEPALNQKKILLAWVKSKRPPGN